MCSSDLGLPLTKFPVEATSRVRDVRIQAISVRRNNWVLIFSHGELCDVALMPRSIHTDLFPHHNFIQLRTLGAIFIDRMRLVFVTGRGKAYPASYYS